MSTLRKVPAWLWAVVVGLSWLVWRMWASAQRESRLRILEQERRRIDDDYARTIAKARDLSEAEFEMLARARIELNVAADRERSDIVRAAAQDQEAFAAHWSKVMGR